MCIGGGKKQKTPDNSAEIAAQRERENQRNRQMQEQQQRQDALFAEQAAIRNAPPPAPPAPVAETAGSAAEGQESSTPALIKKGVGRKKLRTDMTVRGGLNIPTG